MHTCRTSLVRSMFAGTALSIVVLLAGSAAAQATTESSTFLSRQLDRTDFGLSGVGEFTNNTNGTNYLSQQVNLVTSNTLGALGTLHYQKSPFVGFEVNYGYVRYTENYTLTSTAQSPPGSSSYVLGIQTNQDEITVGYRAQSRSQYFGLQPFAAVGAGTILFKPTSGGGQRLPNQYRAGYYYAVGAEAPLLGPHFGVRGQFRQVFYYAPDFLENYLTDKQRQITSEPTIGVFLRF